MKYHISERSQKKTQAGKLLQRSSWGKDSISLGIATHMRREAEERSFRRTAWAVSNRGIDRTMA